MKWNFYASRSTPTIGQLIAGLKPLLPKGGRGVAAPATDASQVDAAVEQLAAYLSESDATALEYFESVGPQLRGIFEDGKFEILAALIESYLLRRSSRSAQIGKGSGTKRVEVNRWTRTR